MPIYRYTNDHPAVFMDLVVSATVQVHKGDGTTVPEPSTVELAPGDYLTTTDTAYVHPYLEDVPVLPESFAPMFNTGGADHANTPANPSES